MQPPEKGLISEYQAFPFLSFYPPPHINIYFLLDTSSSIMSFSTFCLAPPQAYSDDEAKIDDEDAFFQKTIQNLSSVFFIWDDEMTDFEGKIPFVGIICNDIDLLPKVSINTSFKKARQPEIHLKKRLGSKRNLHTINDHSSKSALKRVLGKPPHGFKNTSRGISNLHVDPKSKYIADKHQHNQIGNIIPQAIIMDNFGVTDNLGLLPSSIDAQKLIVPAPAKKIVKSEKKSNSRRGPHSRNTSK